MIRIAVFQCDHLAEVVGRNAPHVVMHSRQYRNRFPVDIDTGKNPRCLSNTRQSLFDYVGSEMLKVQVNMILFGSDATTLAYFDGHRPANDIP